LTGTTLLDLALKQLVASNNGALSTCSSEDKDRLRQRYVYLALVFSAGNRFVTDWFDDANECFWFGVVCSDNTVVKLELNGQGLAGTISVEVGLLTSLGVFSVFSNQLGGSLPLSIGLWTNLFYFDVSSNQLTGIVPSTVSNWKSIQQAFFYGNQFIGRMPIVGSNFCPSSSSNPGSDLWADCTEIMCICCDICFRSS
jgi:Leucine-rich repeat (LRR) protein